MLREELVDILGRIPEVDHPKIQFVMQNGSMMSLDILVRMESTYLVMRGREAGNQDEGRAFFVPYVDISFLKIERVMTLVEMDAMYSDQPGNVKRAAKEPRPDYEADAILAQPSAPQDPASIAKQNLLERIRAAKSISTTPKTFSK